MFQFWFNTFFISNAVATVTDKMQNEDREEMIHEDEPTLKTFELDSNSRYFGIDKENLDKAHKDEKGKIFGPAFRVRIMLFLIMSACIYINYIRGFIISLS